MITTTQLEKDLAEVQRSVDAASYAVESLARALNRAHASVWQLPDDRLAALLNHLGPAQVQSIFAAHQAIATAANAALDASNRSGVRAYASAGRETNLDSDGRISVVPLPTKNTTPEEPTL